MEYNFNLSAAVFNRKSSHLIDYVKWSLRILGKRKTFKMLLPGFETQLLYSFNLNAFAQKLQFGYSFIQNDIEESTLLSHSIL
jgi:iron complex outermembrane receptor protein